MVITRRPRRASSLASATVSVVFPAFFRPSVADTPIYDADSPEAGRWVAIVTDDLDFQAPCRVVRFQDTMWLQLLATLTIEHAQAIDP